MSVSAAAAGAASGAVWFLCGRLLALGGAVAVVHPLPDLLLDLARARSRSRAHIAIAELVDPFVAAIAAAAKTVPLAQLGEWLVIANWLAYSDRPRATRPPFAKLALPPGPTPPGGAAGFELFVPEADAPATVKALSPDDLAKDLKQKI